MKNPFALIAVLVPVLCLPACLAQDEWLNVAQTAMNMQSGTTQGAGLSDGQISAGLKEALQVGTNTVVAQLGKQGGFNLDPKIRIPLPPALANAHAALSKIGLGGMTADLEARMNEAAELAVPEAKALFVSAIKQMTLSDARSILSGQQDAATQYLRKTMGNDLALKAQPIVQTTLNKTGAVQAYDRVVGQYASLPFVSGVKTDVNAYVTQKALDGVFYYVAQEEAAIRQNPAKRTTEILKTVFGGVTP